MWLLLLEAALALALLIFIVVWTMWPKRKDLRRADVKVDVAEPDREARPRNRPDDSA
jgi:hypothetical protein